MKRVLGAAKMAIQKNNHFQVSPILESLIRMPNSFFILSFLLTTIVFETP